MTGQVDSNDLSAQLKEARVRAFLTPGEKPPRELDELGKLLEKAAAIQSHAVTEVTRATYARRWFKFEAWCLERGFSALPASPEVLMLYLASEMEGNGCALTTLRGYAAAVARIHIEAGLASPTRDPAMTMFLRGLSRMVPPRRAVEPIDALRITGLREVCRVIDANAVDAKELRDRAILGLLEAGATCVGLRRLQWSEVEQGDGWATVTLLPVGRLVTVTRVRIVVRVDDVSACPVAALQAWHNAVGESRGRVFVSIVGGQPSEQGLADQAIFHIRRSRLRSLGREGSPATYQEAMRLLGRKRSKDLRDKAILLVGFAGALRRNEATQLKWSDITPRDTAGVILHLRRSKTDQAGRGYDVGIPFGKSSLTCPVTALAEWRERVEAQMGQVDRESPIFVKVGHSGRLGSDTMTDEALTMMIKRRTDAAGLRGHWGGRSLRAGFISTAADLEIPLEKVAAQSRHATLDHLARYIRRLDPFTASAVGRVGL